MYAINGKPIVIEEINEQPTIIGSYERAVDGSLISKKITTKKFFQCSVIVEEEEYNLLQSLLGTNVNFYKEGEELTVYLSKITGKRIKGTTVYEATIELLEV